jgi:hypothetical protein
VNHSYGWKGNIGTYLKQADYEDVNSTDLGHGQMVDFCDKHLGSVIEEFFINYIGLWHHVI